MSKSSSVRCLSLHLLDYVLISFSLLYVFGDMMIFNIEKFYLFLKHKHIHM
jgi:hypothetical protein